MKRLALFGFLYLLIPSLTAMAPAAGQTTVACKPIVTHVGSAFTIVLPANRTTGYSWALEDPLNAAIVTYETKHYVASTAKMMGAPGIETWTFAAAGRGRTLISLKYARPWEKSAPPAKEALYVVVVR